MIMNKKKVLILSGASYMIEIVEIAKKLGLYTIVADNMVESPAKKFADKSYISSINDMEKLAEIVQEEEIDGVFNAFDDINAWYALALCKKTGLPMYTASEQYRSYLGSCRFNEYCQTFNVPVIEEGAFDDWYQQELAQMDFPLSFPNQLPAEKSLQAI